jgi:hypothetical protein
VTRARFAIGLVFACLALTACGTLTRAGRSASESVTQAGLALGVACALKASAWPAVAVIGALVVARWGWRHAGRFVANAATVVIGVSVPVLLGPTAGAMVAQAAGFPMADSVFASPANAPTPGVLLAHGGPVATLVGDALMLLVAVALLAALVWRPPRTLTLAAVFLAAALVAAMLVLPTSRAGYLLYPVVLLVLALRGRRRASRPTDVLAQRVQPPASVAIIQNP